MKQQGTRTQREEDLRMWAGIASGALVLVVLGFVILYGMKNGVFS